MKTDKNLGPALIRKDEYIALAYRDHLNDIVTYRQLDPDELQFRVSSVCHAIENFLFAYDWK
jgi:hypothetical protein